MRLDRLFNVLVIGGAALALAPSGCDGDERDEGGTDDGDDESESSGEEESSGSGDSSSSSGDDGQESTEDGGETGAESGDETSSETGDQTSDETGVDPMCEADEFACGCPCCWIQECNNTEDCCVGWCGECC